MSEFFKSSYTNLEPPIPATLSEIYDLLASMIGSAPTFVDESGIFWDRNINTVFGELAAGFEAVRKKLGEDNYDKLTDLAARAKALFLEDPEETNGKTNQGIRLIWEIEEIIQSVRRRRVDAKLKDGEGDVSGD